MGLLAVAALLAACGSAGTATQSPRSLPSAAPTHAAPPTGSPDSPGAPAPVATDASASFPRTVVDAEGATVEIERAPETIVSLTPANTEIVFALGAGDRLVGGTDFDDYPPEAAGVTDVVQGVQVLTEQIIDLEPDLVLAGGNNFTPPAEVERMRDLDIDVVVVYPESVEEVFGDIALIGAAVGSDERATEIVSEIRARVDEVTTAVQDLEKPRTFYEIGNEPEIYGPAPDSFIADMVELAGGDPITTTDPAVFSIPLERLVDEDPEVIVLGDAAYGVCPETVSSRPGWETITAVKNGEIRPVDDIIVTRPGPRLGEGLAALAMAIHPDAAIAPPATGQTHCTST